MKCLIWIFGVTVTWLSPPPAFAAEGAQPLTRAEAWDDRANVCGGSENAAESKKEKKKKKRGKHKKDQSRLKEEPPEADSP
jgi:hypothetical protein